MARLLRLFFIFCVCIACMFAGAGIYIVQNQVVDFSVLENYNPGQPSILLDDQGNEWARFALDKREFVSIHDMPEHLIQAFIAAEDHTFFNHVGLSLKGIVRSLFVNLYYGKKMQGASTITQQLVRLLFFNAKKTFVRKIKEQIFALLVERQCTKEQILEIYLNHVYFGHGIYGVNAAAKRFWNKSIDQVTIDEAAVLAAIMRSPVHYSPLSAQDASKRRRDHILNWMFKLGCIDENSWKQAKEKSLVIHDGIVDSIAPHAKESIRMQLENILGKNKLYTGGFVIQTTINRDIQIAAEKSFTTQITKLRKNMHEKIDGALVSLDPNTGQVKALIGGYDFAISKYNRALQARRQMGSIFKTFVYAAALEQGYSFADVDVDEPISIPQNGGVWEPRNSTRTFSGLMTHARALSYSNNILPIKLTLAIGPEKVVDMAERCHIPGPLLPYPSLALGCVDVTAIDVAGAINVIVNYGKYVQPHMIKWVKNKLGEKIYRFEEKESVCMSSAIASQIARVLTFNIKRLQKVIGDQWFGGQAIGKTGTTNDSRTCWFFGATPDLTTAIYVGTDYNESLGQNVFGVKTAFPIWFYMHKQLQNSLKKFYVDPSLKEVMINWKTGQPATCQDDPEVVSILV